MAGSHYEQYVYVYGFVIWDNRKKRLFFYYNLGLICVIAVCIHFYIPAVNLQWYKIWTGIADKKLNPDCWKTKCLLTNSVLHFLLYLPSLSFLTWESPKIFNQCRPCPLPARLIKACGWGVFHQAPLQPISRSFQNPMQIPDLSIALHFFRIYWSNREEGKRFQSCEGNYTPVKTCVKKKDCDTVGHGETLNIYSCTTERRWGKNVLCGGWSNNFKRKRI